MPNVKTTIINIMREVLELEREFSEAELTMETIDNWDSLSHLEIMAGIEEEFGIELDVDEMVEMTSLEAILRILNGRIYGE